MSAGTSKTRNFFKKLVLSLIENQVEIMPKDKLLKSNFLL